MHQETQGMYSIDHSHTRSFGVKKQTLKVNIATIQSELSKVETYSNQQLLIIS